MFRHTTFRDTLRKIWQGNLVLVNWKLLCTIWQDFAEPGIVCGVKKQATVLPQWDDSIHCLRQHPVYLGQRQSCQKNGQGLSSRGGGGDVVPLPTFSRQHLGGFPPSTCKWQRCTPSPRPSKQDVSKQPSPPSPAAFPSWLVCPLIFLEESWLNIQTEQLADALKFLISGLWLNLRVT